MSQSDANSRSFLYQGASALSHLITHNLGNRWVGYTAFFTSTGGEVVATDIDIVQALNDNQIRITLTAPSAISVRVNV